MPTMSSPLAFFAKLRWLDGKPLLSTIQPYRRRIFEQAYETLPDGSRRYNRVLCGRGKKNDKTTDLVIAAMFELLVPVDPRGNECYVVANDEGQANNALDLAKKLVRCNPILQRELDIRNKEIVRKDGRGFLRILPARDTAGLHGTTYRFLGLDEIHAYRNYDLLEAMAPDPTRDYLLWISTYDTIYNTAGVPLFDLKRTALAGSDPRLYFSWYSADHCTDPDFANLEPELRANPSIGSTFGPKYLEQQRLHLPAHKFRRLHLNLPGMPDGGVLDPGAVEDSIVVGRRSLPPELYQRDFAFVDLSLGGKDSMVLSIARHGPDGQLQLCAMVSQPPTKFYSVPGTVRERFIPLLREYGITSVVGDAVGGPDGRREFEHAGIGYQMTTQAGWRSKHEIYSEFQVLLNARRVELLDHTLLREQLLGLVYRGQSIDHMPGEHDDYANSAAGALVLASRRGAVSQGGFRAIRSTMFDDYAAGDGSTVFLHSDGAIRGVDF